MFVIHFVVRPLWNKCIALLVVFHTKAWRYYDTVLHRVVYPDGSYIGKDGENDHVLFHGEDGSTAMKVMEIGDKYALPDFNDICNYFGSMIRKGE